MSEVGRWIESACCHDGVLLEADGAEDAVLVSSLHSAALQYQFGRVRRVEQVQCLNLKQMMYLSRVFAVHQE